MSVAIMLLDKTTDGKHYQESELRLVSQRTTLREILEKRIRQEVDKYNSGNQHLFFGLIQPTNAENKLNGYELRKPRQVSYEKQLNLAIEAFETAGFFVLLDDRQIEGLDDLITLRDDSRLSFVKLVPLVGG
jgi:hypothetical protein